MYESHLNEPHVPPNARILLHLDKRRGLSRGETVQLLLEGLGQLLAFHLRDLLELDEFFALLRLIGLMGTGARGFVLVRASTVGSQMSVVHCRDYEKVNEVPC